MEQTAYKPAFDDTITTEGKACNTLLCIDLIKQYKDIVYKTSAKEVGKTAHLAKKGQDFGHNGGFSKVSKRNSPNGNGSLLSYSGISLQKTPVYSICRMRAILSSTG